MGEDEGVLCVILKAVTGERGVAPGLSPCRGGSLWCVQCQAGKPVSDRSHARAGLDLYSVCGRCGAYTDPHKVTAQDVGRSCALSPESDLCQQASAHPGMHDRSGVGSGRRGQKAEVYTALLFTRVFLFGRMGLLSFVEGLAGGIIDDVRLQEKAKV